MKRYVETKVIYELTKKEVQAAILEWIEGQGCYPRKLEIFKDGAARASLTTREQTPLPMEGLE